MKITIELNMTPYNNNMNEDLGDVKDLVQEYQDLVNKVIAKRLKVIGQARRDLSREVLGEVAAEGTLPEIVQKVIEEYRKVCAELSEAVDTWGGDRTTTMAEERCDSGVQTLVTDHREKADTRVHGTWYCTPCLDFLIETGAFDG